MKINKNECESQGVELRKLKNISKRLSKCLKEIDELGLSVFGGTWSLTVRGADELIIAEFDECITSGGCGTQSVSEDGLIRGER